MGLHTYQQVNYSKGFLRFPQFLQDNIVLFTSQIPYLLSIYMGQLFHNYLVIYLRITH